MNYSTEPHHCVTHHLAREFTPRPIHTSQHSTFALSLGSAAHVTNRRRTCTAQHPPRVRLPLPALPERPECAQHSQGKVLFIGLIGV